MRNFLLSQAAARPLSQYGKSKLSTRFPELPFWILKEELESLPRLPFNGKIIIVESLEAQARAVQFLSEAGQESGCQRRVLGFDSETKVEFPRNRGGHVKKNKVATIQISTIDQTCFIFRLRTESNERRQVSEVGIGPALKSLIESERTTLVAHGLKSDLICLQRDYGVRITGGVCLQQCAQAIPSFPQSLNGNCGVFLGHSLDKSKRLTLSNWEQAILTEKQRSYAGIDAFASVALYYELRNLLASSSLGLLPLEARIPPPRYHWGGSKGGWVLDDCAQRRLKCALEGKPFELPLQPYKIIHEFEMNLTGDDDSKIEGEG